MDGRDSANIAARFARTIRAHSDVPLVRSVGVVSHVGDSVARIRGLGGVGALELLEFAGGTLGMAMNLEEAYAMPEHQWTPVGSSVGRDSLRRF